MYTVGDTFVYTPIRENRTVSRLAEVVPARRAERKPERRPERVSERVPERLPERDERGEVGRPGHSDRLDRLEETVHQLAQMVAHLSELVERLGSPAAAAMESTLVSQPTGEQQGDIKVSVYGGESATAVVGQVRIMQYEG